MKRKLLIVDDEQGIVDMMRCYFSETAVTIMSLVMSITVFITLQSFLSLLDVSGSLSEHLGDYSIVNQYEGISPEEKSAGTGRKCGLRGGAAVFHL